MGNIVSNVLITTYHVAWVVDLLEFSFCELCKCGARTGITAVYAITLAFGISVL